MLVEFLASTGPGREVIQVREAAFGSGLAAWLRTRKLGVPYAGKPLPLDVGKVKGIPDHLRRAVILRDRHCAWPGGCDKPPAGCQVHHLVHGAHGGKTRLSGLILLCEYRHQVCVHRLGWTLVLHADGTTEAGSPTSPRKTWPRACSGWR